MRIVRACGAGKTAILFYREILMALYRGVWEILLIILLEHSACVYVYMKRILI